MARPGIKNALKRAVKGGLAAFGPVLRARGPVSRILTYHSVGARNHDMNVTPDAFRAQMAWLAQHASVISLADAAAGQPGVALTFDDGYRDNRLNAAPVLAEHGFPATVFLVAGRMGGFIAGDEGDEANRLLTWAEARELEAMGWTLGAHTMNHRRLSHLSEDEQRIEIAACHAAFEEHLGCRACIFAYPYGSSRDYDEASVRLVRESGYAFAVSNRYGPNRPDADRWTLRRIWIDATDALESFQAKVDGRLDGLRALDSRIAVRARSLLNAITGS